MSGINSLLEALIGKRVVLAVLCGRTSKVVARGMTLTRCQGPSYKGECYKAELDQCSVCFSAENVAGVQFAKYLRTRSIPTIVFKARRDRTKVVYKQRRSRRVAA
jgi:hypothetical protein